MSQTIHYTITPTNPNAHIFSVRVKINSPDPIGQTFYLPAWIPGSYMIRDFCKNISQLRAFDDNNNAVEINQLDKLTWQCAPCSSVLTITYNVYAWDLSVRAAHLDHLHGFFNGSSVFICISGKETAKATIDIEPPAKDELANWHVATTYTGVNVNEQGFGTYQADNYEELIDHPVEMGLFKKIAFTVSNTQHEIVLTGEHHCDDQRMATDVGKICQTHIALFGELPKLEKYSFLTMVVGDGYGGLEHRSSCSLLCSRKDLPQLHQKEVTDEYRALLGLFSHEYFHTWNIKRIKPDCYLPYNLDHEIYTRQLWAFEGITSYYDDLCLLRSGVITIDSYLELLAQNITRVLRGSGRFKQSVADSSFNTWTKFYKQDESAPNTIVSYYAKGALIALALDLVIRKQTQNTKSLDDVMRTLWLQYGKPGKGVPEGEIEKIASQVAGTNLDAFFVKYLYGTEDLPLNELFDGIGIQYQLRPMLNADDKGGKPETFAQPDQHPYFGARVINDSAGVIVTHVYENGSAENAGLSAGDVVIALDNLKVNKSNFDTLYTRFKVGQTVTLHAFRRDELLQLTLTVQAAPINTCVLTTLDSAKSDTISARNDWLHIKEKQ